MKHRFWLDFIQCLMMEFSVAAGEICYSIILMKIYSHTRNGTFAASWNTIICIASKSNANISKIAHLKCESHIFSLNHIMLFIRGQAYMWNTSRMCVCVCLFSPIPNKKIKPITVSLLVEYYGSKSHVYTYCVCNHLVISSKNELKNVNSMLTDKEKHGPYKCRTHMWIQIKACVQHVHWIESYRIESNQSNIFMRIVVKFFFRCSLNLSAILCLCESRAPFK